MPADVESFALGLLTELAGLLLVAAAVLAIVAVIVVAGVVWSLVEFAREQSRVERW